MNIRTISTNLYGDIAYDVIDSVHGQLSDGMWENARGYDKYWTNLKPRRAADNRIYFEVNADYNNSYCGKWIENPFKKMSDEEFLNWYANKLKAVIVQESKDCGWHAKWWSRTNTADKTSYLNRSTAVSVADVYCVYDALKGRICRSSSDVKDRIIGKPLTREMICEMVEAGKLKARNEYAELKKQLKEKYEADLMKAAAEFRRKIDALESEVRLSSAALTLKLLKSCL